MKTLQDLATYLKNIDGKSYRLYKEITGRYSIDDYILSVDHVQGDPFAAPSSVSIHMPMAAADFPPETYKSRSREIALRDYMIRSFDEALSRHVHKNRGTGKSGEISIDTPGQEILERSAITIEDNQFIVRFTMALPGFGRRVAADNCIAMFTEDIPLIAASSLYHKNLDADTLTTHIETSENADHLRGQLKSRGLAAFAADGAILPRLTGIDDHPLDRDRAVAFSSPESVRVTFELLNGGSVTGMGIPEGVTLIAGGGYHGKSTLLKALERGIYNHLPGDGRELVVTRSDAVKIRGEEGRRVESVCITPFISNLPGGGDTDSFKTDNASGSTSQAAGIIEAVEMGAEVLLIDEDTSATNFMIRDHRMQELVAKDREPITPFIDRVSRLHTDMGISTILVMGGSGDYFDTADLVITMDHYLPSEVTAEAKDIARRIVTNRITEAVTPFPDLEPRMPDASSIDPSRGQKKVKVAPRTLHTISFGKHEIDLAAVEQLVHISQTRAIGDAMVLAKNFINDGASLVEIIDLVMGEIDKRGLTILPSYQKGFYAAFRKYELAAAFNRLRSLRVRSPGQGR